MAIFLYFQINNKLYFSKFIQMYIKKEIVHCATRVNQNSNNFIIEKILGDNYAINIRNILSTMRACV